MNMAATGAVNHHADHPGFAGVTGLLAGLTMIIGRGAVARRLLPHRQGADAARLAALSLLRLTERIRRMPVSTRTLLNVGRLADGLSKVVPVPPVLTYEAAWLLTTAQRTDDSAALAELGRPWRSTRQALRDSISTC